MLPQQYCLRWKYHHSNLQTMFSQLLDRGCFCDVTLACEGQLIRAHRVVLCACSTFFDTVLTNYASDRDPIIIMKDVTFADVKCLIEFMYKGEINVEHANLASLLKTADDLKIKGLAEVSWREDEADVPQLPTECLSPGRSQENIPQSNHHSINETEQRNLSPALSNRGHIRMPMLTPIPTTNVVPDHHLQHQNQHSQHHYVGPKRKRGRPPLDETYDVFNVPKMPPLEPPPPPASDANKYLHSKIHSNQQTHIDNSRSSHSSFHIHHHNNNLNHNQHLHHHQHHNQSQPLVQLHHHEHHQQQQNPRIPRPIVEKEEVEEIETNHVVQPDPDWITGNMEAHANDCESLQSEISMTADHRIPDLSQQEPQNRRVEEESATAKEANEQEYYENNLREHNHLETTSNDKRNSIPLPLEMIEEKKEQQEQDPLEETLSPAVPPEDSDNGQEQIGTPNADDHEDYETAECKLTNEEMAQWNDVIKMDAYLAKGRRPQFWEEPFTRRVLDAIKNKKLEMKKAAQVLGVSYGTLYGRYREVYGCLKHPYRGNQRFDVVWPDKRNTGVLPLPLEVGKIRPKDLSELWMRPQL